MGTDETALDGGEVPGRRRWQWCPGWTELRTHYFREIGFLASFSQLLGATIFWIAGIAALPPIQERLHGRSLDGVYWAPQVSHPPLDNPILPPCVRNELGPRVLAKGLSGKRW